MKVTLREIAEFAADMGQIATVLAGLTPLPRHLYTNDVMFVALNVEIATKLSSKLIHIQQKLLTLLPEDEIGLQKDTESIQGP